MQLKHCNEKQKKEEDANPTSQSTQMQCIKEGERKKTGSNCGRKEEEKRRERKQESYRLVTFQ